MRNCGKLGLCTWNLRIQKSLIQPHADYDAALHVGFLFDRKRLIEGGSVEREKSSFIVYIEEDSKQRV